MNRAEITIEVKSFRQTNGKTFHVRSNCGNHGEKGAKLPDPDTKLAETLLLAFAVASLKDQRRRTEILLDQIQSEIPEKYRYRPEPKSPNQPRHHPPYTKKEGRNGYDT